MGAVEVALAEFRAGAEVVGVGEVLQRLVDHGVAALDRGLRPRPTFARSCRSRRPETEGRARGGIGRGLRCGSPARAALPVEPPATAGLRRLAVRCVGARRHVVVGSAAGRDPRDSAGAAGRRGAAATALRIAPRVAPQRAAERQALARLRRSVPRMVNRATPRGVRIGRRSCEHHRARSGETQCKPRVYSAAQVNLRSGAGDRRSRRRFPGQRQR